MQAYLAFVTVEDDVATIINTEKDLQTNLQK